MTGTASVPFAPINYSGGTVVTDANLSSALPGVSSSQTFDVSVKKGGTTTDVPIDLSQVQGPLTLGNIVSYVNQQLSGAGFTTRFSTAMTSGSISDTTKATWGVQIQQGAGETIALSSTQATPSLYLAGSSGNSASTVSTTTNSSGTSVTTTPPISRAVSSSWTTCRRRRKSFRTPQSIRRAVPRLPRRAPSIRMATCTCWAMHPEISAANSIRGRRAFI